MPLNYVPKQSQSKPTFVTMIIRSTCNAKHVLKSALAFSHARSLRASDVFLALISKTCLAKEVLEGFHIYTSAARPIIEHFLNDKAAEEGIVAFEARAHFHVRRLQHSTTTTGHFLLAVLDSPDKDIRRFLLSQRVDPEELSCRIEGRLYGPGFPYFEALAKFKHHSDVTAIFNAEEDFRQKTKYFVGLSDFANARISRASQEQLLKKLETRLLTLWNSLRSTESE